MKRIIFVIYFFLFLIRPNAVFAIENPLDLPNNKMGVHILFTSELNKAARLINSNGGDWGYVTIPIQAGDKDLEKWQAFMDIAKENHVIPIIRIASENFYFNTSIWRKPTEEDIVDFANFLNSLEWPVKNRYVVIFNEVNRGDEWEGVPNPNEYALILDYAAEVFKSLSSDFFIISAGLDNAAAKTSDSMDEYNFMIQMTQEIPDIFSKIDGLGSHSYPNPGFSQPPSLITRKNITSFRFERNLALSLSDKELPVFITETGWSRDKLSEDQIAYYFKYAFANVWNDENIIAVTPFLLHAGTLPFSQFSLLADDGDHSEISNTLYKIAKTKGEPTINNTPSSLLLPINTLPYKTFSQKAQFESSPVERARVVIPFLKWILKVSD